MEHIYKKIEITGSSKKSIGDAITNAISHAGKSVRNMRWFEVVDTRGEIENQQVAYWQVTLKIGFAIE